MIDDDDLFGFGGGDDDDDDDNDILGGKLFILPKFWNHLNFRQKFSKRFQKL